MIKVSNLFSPSSNKNYIRNLPALADSIYPGSKGIKRIKKNARFCLWGVAHAKTVKAMLSVFSHPELSPVLELEPRVIEKPLKPYLCVNWRKKERLTQVCNHFLYLKNTFGNHVATFFTDLGYTLLTFQDSQNVTYKVQLCRGASREGSLGLYLLDDQNRNIYTLTFHISPGTTNTLYIGALQGPSDDISDRQQVIKTLTRSLHGLRTKALMVELVMILAKVLEIDEIKAISNKGHIYQALRYIGSKNKSVTFDYDDLWTEYGATRLNKYFYSLPTNPPRKDPASLKKTKRRLYSKRYLWLDEAEEAIKGRIKEITQTTKSAL